jgi:site-specific recombinase XerD
MRKTWAKTHKNAQPQALALRPLPTSPTSAPARERLDPKMTEVFILRSLSEETRASYKTSLSEFFRFLNQRHPKYVTPQHVIAYRDHLLVTRGLRPTTVNAKLSAVRSFFSYLEEAKVIESNPASTRFVAIPQVPNQTSGRALSPKEVRNLLAGPDRSKPEGARDYAILLLMLRLSLRVSEVSTLLVSAFRREGDRTVLRLVVKGGREESWPVPPDVKEAIDDYLRLDRRRRNLVKSGGPRAYLFQPIVNYRTLEFDRPLTRQHVGRIVQRWADYARLGKVTPHDLRRSVVTKLLNDGRSYRDIQMITKHRDPKTVQKYDLERENLDRNPANDLSWD